MINSSNLLSVFFHPYIWRVSNHNGAAGTLLNGNIKAKNRALRQVKNLLCFVSS